MEATEEQNRTFREMIREHGQTVPILVRPKAKEAGRFEVAFGHRRLRAARELGIKVRAVVRNLTDEQLVVAQGQENSGRTDLSFIERARFAARLENHKFTRETIMAALNIDKAALSRLILMATRIPQDIINAIGPAPSFGRVRWQELADLLDGELGQTKARDLISKPEFAVLDSDKRFEFLHGSLTASTKRARSEPYNATDGTRLVRIARTENKITLSFDTRIVAGFGDFVAEKLQFLYEEYKRKPQNINKASR
jgi:ParB family chromosome partitioning protein